MTETRLIISDSSTGHNLAELPWQQVSRSRVLSGCGQLSTALPVGHPAVREGVLGQLRATPDREVTVYRGGHAVWNGPLTGTACTWTDDTFNLVAREASWIFGKRVLEERRTYSGEDKFDIVRDLDDYFENKTATGDDGLTLGDDIVAALPRFSVDASTAGVTTDADFAARARHTWQELLDFLAADPETGFEWRMDYATGSTRRSVHRTLTLGYPNLGATLDQQLFEQLLVDFSRELDWEQAATRVHVIGSGYTKTLQSSVAITNGVQLLESVDDLTNTSDQGFINARARDLRRLSRPAPRSFTASYTPGFPLAYGFCDLGDTVPFEIINPDILSITSDVRRVIQEDVVVDEDGAEVVTLTFNDPLSDLGA